MYEMCVRMQAFGISTTAVNGNLAVAQPLNTTDTAASAAECQAFVRALYPAANAAEYSNTGATTCRAVFNACVSRPMQLVGTVLAIVDG